VIVGQPEGAHQQGAAANLTRRFSQAGHSIRITIIFSSE